MNISELAKNSLLSGLKSGLESGDSSPRIDIYDSANTLLSSVNLPKPFGAISEGKLSEDTIDQALTLESGNPSIAKLFNGNGDHFLDLTVGILQSGQRVTDIVIDSDAETVYKGGSFKINSIDIGIGNVPRT